MSRHPVAEGSVTTLVRLVRREGLETVFTPDDEFLVYRIRGRRRFSVLPLR